MIVITQNLIVLYFEKNVFIDVKMIKFSYNSPLFSIVVLKQRKNNEIFPLLVVVFVDFPLL